MATYSQGDADLSEADQVDPFGFDLPEDEWVGRVHDALAAEDADRDEVGERTGTGTRIGSYELLEQIGTGGMGTVWRARRADKHPDRIVALKLLRRGMDSANAVRRFRLEEQVLARLEHPNIARLYDGGVLSDGIPYLVMEYVEGLPIDSYVARHRMSVQQRLALFEQVCAAVQFAHASLVLHRDIKPANILVGNDGVPRLLDFGIAKILNDSESGGLGITATDTSVLTPRYASPEQISGDRLTVGTDIYSLGVVLYELLVGQSPFPNQHGSRRALERAILEQQPRRASVAVSEADATAGSTNRPLSRQLRGDLDSICTLCLQKDPKARYGSAQALREDIRRYLDGQPLLARPPGPLLRAWRFVRRRRGMIVAATLGGLLSIALCAVFVFESFIVPDWVEEYKREAHLAIVNGSANNAAYNVLFFRHPDYLTYTSTFDEDRFNSIRTAYEAALDWDPKNEVLQNEHKVLLLSAAIRRAKFKSNIAPADLGDHLSLTKAYAESWFELGSRPTVSIASLNGANQDDLRSLGLLGWFCGDYSTVVRAWSHLPLGVLDPMVETSIGYVYLALDDCALAYPRLLSAHRAYPESGDIAINLADAAVRCDDVDQAQTILERIDQLPIGDRSFAVERVKMLVLLKTERLDDALLLADKFNLLGGNPVAAVQLAQFLESRGQVYEAAETLLGRLDYARDRVTLAYGIRLTETWWSQLSVNDQQALENEIHRTSAQESAFADLLSQYRRASDKLRDFFLQPHALSAQSHWMDLRSSVAEDELRVAREQLLILVKQLPSDSEGARSIDSK